VGRLITLSKVILNKGTDDVYTVMKIPIKILLAAASKVGHDAPSRDVDNVMA
jgi:hypothetical protein